MILPNRLHAVILDMDGTLHDTEVVFSAALKDAARQLGFEISDAFCHSLIGIPGQEGDKMIQTHLGAEFPLAEYRRLLRVYCSQIFSESTPIKPGAVELVAYLADKNIPVAVATSSSRQSAERDLASSGLRARLPVLFTRDDVERGKPYPDLFLAAAAALGIAPAHCLAVEDSHNGIRAAHAAGMMGVMVPDILPPTPEITAICIGVAADLHEVQALVASHWGRP